MLQGLHPHLEAPVVGPAGHAVHPRPEVPLAVEPPVQLLLQRVPLRNWQEERWIQHRLQEPGVGGQPVGDARGAAHHHADEVQEPGVGAQHGEERDVLRQLGQEAVQPGEGAVWVRRFAERLHQVMHHGADDVPYRFGRGGRVPALAPATQHVKGPLRVLEAVRAQPVQGVGQALGAGEHRFGDVMLALGHVEARHVQRMDVPGRGAEACAQGIHGGRAHEPRDVGDAVVRGRQGLRLVVVDHLQAVLNAAEQDVGVVERRRLARQDVVVAFQRLQHGRHAGAAQAGA